MLGSLKRVSELPEFPKNDLGLIRGTILEVTSPEAARQLGLQLGMLIPLGYDGIYVCSGPFTWSIDQLINEISGGHWKVRGTISRTNEFEKIVFSATVEGILVVPA